MFVPMRNYRIADALVHVAGNDPFIDQVLLGTVGPEANDPLCPSARHAGNLQQLLQRCMIQIHTILGVDRSAMVRRRCGRRTLGQTGGRQHHHRENKDTRSGRNVHRHIFSPAPRGTQVAQRKGRPGPERQVTSILRA
jgi:hypothetical protein